MQTTGRCVSMSTHEVVLRYANGVYTRQEFVVTLAAASYLLRQSVRLPSPRAYPFNRYHPGRSYSHVHWAAAIGYQYVWQLFLPMVLQ